MKRITRLAYIAGPFLIVIGLLLYASFPLFQKRFIPTHDGEYHIIRFAQFFGMIKAGYFSPRWAPTLNSGYGVPLFNFFYPFPNYIGALLHLGGVSFVDSFKVGLALAYIVSGVACYFWLRKLFGQFASVIGTVVFSYVPYWFVYIYVRGSIGEVWALAFMILSFVFVEYEKLPLLGLSVAGLVLSHNISAMIFLPILALYIVIRKREYLIGIILGVLGSSYFWVPALAERSFVTGLNATNFADHFPMLVQLLIPSWGTGFSGQGYTYDQLSFQIGIMPLVVLMLSFVVFIIRKKRALVSEYWLFVGAALLAFYLMLTPSIWFWKLIPLMQFTQYPWRLLAIYIPVSGFLAAWISAQIKWKWIMILVSIGAIAFAIGYIRPVSYAPRDDAYYLSKKEFTDGTSSLGNSFSTRWTPWIKKRATQKIEWSTNDANATVSIDTSKPLEYHLEMNSKAPISFTANTLYYPGWNVLVDRRRAQIRYEKDGLIHFTVSSGVHRIVIIFSETPFRTICDLVSIMSLFCLMVWAILDFIYAYRHSHITAYQ